MVLEETVNVGYTYHHSAKNLLYSHLLVISMKGMCRTVILHMDLCGFETLFFTLRGKH